MDLSPEYVKMRNNLWIWSVVRIDGKALVGLCNEKEIQ